MKLVTTLIMSAFLLFLVVQIYSFWGKGDAAQARYETLKEELQKAQMDSDKLEADYQFFLNPENIEKELRARFNYHAPDEKMIIIVPQKATST